MSTKPRTLRLTITASVLETGHGAGGPAALLHWSDQHGFAVVAASCAWSNPASAGLAAVEVGDRIVVTGDITETPRRPWLPTETLPMAVKAVDAPQPARKREAKQ